MFELSLHELLVICSSLACVAGIGLLVSDRNSAKDDVEAADHMLMLMTFVYWLVYCGAVGLQKLILPEWEIAMLSAKLTSVIAFLLTASCILSLPLNRVADRQAE
jgi:hydrogenase/urease accessory protein HupE